MDRILWELQCRLLVVVKALCQQNRCAHVHMHGSRCVLDNDMALGNKSLPFHTLGFNMIGFAKIKYILNTLALGRDVVFMDTDIMVGGRVGVGLALCQSRAFYT